MNIAIIKAAFAFVTSQELELYVQQQPTGKYVRMLWYLYEKLMNISLKLDNLVTGAYVYLLDPENYYVGLPIKQARYRVYDNLLGDVLWCPIVRRTQRLKNFEHARFDLAIKKLLDEYPAALQKRAVDYLYVKETRSSYAIEHENPSQSRMQRFISLLSKADRIGVLTKQVLLEIQNVIVESRFANQDYCVMQNYVGQEMALDNQLIRYISPKPEDVAGLMEGLLAIFDRMVDAGFSPVIIATVLSFGFVFIHPFDDGNGRLHRFLIHYFLRLTGFVQSGTIVPISITMLHNRSAYDEALERFSKPLLELLTEYTLDDIGVLAVNQDSVDFYRYLDYTSMAEFLFACLEKTVTEALPKELAFLVGYDQARKALVDIVDMPDRELDLFIKCVMQNNGNLAGAKRKKYFSMLIDEEVVAMEAMVENYLLTEV